MYGNVPASPGSLRRRLARLFYFYAGSVHCPRSFEAAAAGPGAHFIRRQAVGNLLFQRHPQNERYCNIERDMSIPNISLVVDFPGTGVLVISPPGGL